MNTKICSICIYSTNLTSNYNRHINSKKHQHNIDNDKNKHITKKICMLCKYSTRWKSNYDRHINSKKHKNMKNKKKIIKLLTELIVSNKENNTPKLSNINYIKKKYPNALPATAPKKITMTLDTLNEAIYILDPVTICVRLLEEFYLDDINESEQSTWNIDMSRAKYATKGENEWEIDPNGDKMLSALFKHIKPLCEKLFIDIKQIIATSDSKTLSQINKNLDKCSKIMDFIYNLSDYKFKNKVAKRAAKSFYLKRTNIDNGLIKLLV